MRAPLRVAIVAPLVAPLGDAHPYGNQHFSRDLAQGLSMRGHDVVVYAAAGSDVPGVVTETVDVPVAARRRFVLLRGNRRGESDAMRRAFDALFARLRRESYDVVSQHAFDREAIDGCEDLPALHTLHLPPMRDDVVAIVRNCDGVLASVSNHCARSWSDVLDREVLALPNGVPDFGPPVDCTTEDIALIAGRISREKGIATAIVAARAAGLMPIVAGEIYDHDYFERDVEPLLTDGPLVSPMPRAALGRVMARAAVALMPIEWDEPFGLVAAEAQLAGCPVVGYRRGALPEVVREGIGGFLVDPGDEDALVAAIADVHALDRRAIRDQALRRFSMAACIGRYEAALHEVAQSRVTS
ncbi:MAG TPA: glycosyltransferase [Casimicrobiaceae bacterium]|nr:glycosyltransferase [Casimicrobiaceae bacterium]